jgi:hypothetical protein
MAFAGAGHGVDKDGEQQWPAPNGRGVGRGGVNQHTDLRFSWILLWWLMSHKGKLTFEFFTFFLFFTSSRYASGNSCWLRLVCIFEEL